MKLFLGMMQHAGLMANDELRPEYDFSNGQRGAVLTDEADEIAKNFRPNRAQRRAMNKMRTERRWDKRLADHYGIPKAFRSHSIRHGGSVEMVLSEMLQQGVIKYRPMPEDGSAS